MRHFTCIQQHTLSGQGRHCIQMQPCMAVTVHSLCVSVVQALGECLPPCVGVRCMVVMTQRPLHAYETVRDLPLSELEMYDGILAVSSSVCG